MRAYRCANVPALMVSDHALKLYLVDSLQLQEIEVADAQGTIC